MDKPMTFEEVSDYVFSAKCPFGDTGEASSYIDVEEALKFAYKARDAELDALRKENQLMREVVRAARDIFNPNDSNARIKLANAFEEYDVATASQSRTEEEKSDLTKAVEKARGGTMPPPNMQGYA